MSPPSSRWAVVKNTRVPSAETPLKRASKLPVPVEIRVVVPPERS